MKIRGAVVLAVILGVPAPDGLAQQPPAAEPALLTLPMGARVRLQMQSAEGQRIKGVLVSADSASLAIVPEDAPPLGANQLRLPSASVTRLELQTGRKRHWLWGLVVGTAAGLAVGATAQGRSGCSVSSCTGRCRRPGRASSGSG